MNYILQPIREAFKGLFRHFSMTFSSLMAVSVTLALVSLFLMLTVNLQDITRTVESKVQIHVQIEPEVDEAGIQALQTRIEAINGVQEVTFSSKEEELEAFIESYGKEGEIFEMYRGEQNPMRNAFIVELGDSVLLESIGNQIKNMEGIEKAAYGGTNTLQLIKMLQRIRDGGLMLVSILGVLALFLIINTIKITIQSRSHEISIMRTIGATNNFIRAPFVIEGFFIGLFGSLIPIGVSILGYRYVYNALGGVLFTPIFPLREVYPFVWFLSYLLAMLGIVLGLVGSFISVTRYLRGVR